MQKITLSTYPLLFSIKPIEGVVYKATELVRPHPKITAMSIDEVQKHQKRESTNVLPKDTRRSTELRRKRARYPSDPATAAPTVLEAYPGPGTVAQPSTDTEYAQATLDKKNPSPVRRLKNALKKGFKAKDSTKFSSAYCDNEQHAPESCSDNSVRPGFCCAPNECATCSPPPSTPQHRDPIGRTFITAPQIGVRYLHPSVLLEFPTSQPILQDTFSFVSGFATSLSASSSSSPDFVSPTSIDLDIFPDFDGVHIEPTPPQIAPIRPLTAFVEKLRGTIISHAIDDIAANSSSSCSSSDAVDDTQLTTPDILLTPKVSSSGGDEWHSAMSTPSRRGAVVACEPSTPRVSSSNDEEWHSATSTPCPRGLEVPHDQREWSFEISSTARRVLENTGCAAQERRREEYRE